MIEYYFENRVSYRSLILIDELNNELAHLGLK